MKFELSHTFTDISLPDFCALYFDEPFNEALCLAVKLQRTLLEHQIDGSQWKRSVKVIPNRQLPPAASKILGSDTLSYIEHITFEPESGKGQWHSEPAIMADKIVSSGGLHFYESPQGIHRKVFGEVKVKIFGLGGLLEKLIVSDLKSSYDQAAAFTQDWIQSHRPS